MLEGLVGEVATLALETGRTAGVMVIAPLPWTEAPAKSRAVLALLLAAVAHGAAPLAPDAVSSAKTALFAMPFEVLVGLAMGFVVRLAVSAVEVAGDAMAPLLGLGIASIFDPQSGAVDTVLGRMLRLLALLVAVLLGLHRVVIGALVASFRVLPAGSVADPSLATPALVKMSVMAISTGLKLALPVVAVLLMTQLALAFVSRAAPAMQIFSVGFAISLTVGAVVFVLVLPDFARETAADLSAVGGRIEAVVGALGER
jgi:flagellar biosynthetic protein FliR